MGRDEDAVSRARRAKQLNPLSLAANLNLGWQLFQAGKYIEANAEIDKLIEFNPKFWGGHWAKGHLYIQHGMYEKAINEFQQAVELEGGHTLPISALGYTFAVAGMPDEARRIIAELESISKDVYVSPYHVATHSRQPAGLISSPSELKVASYFSCSSAMASPTGKAAIAPTNVTRSKGGRILALKFIPISF